MMPARQAPGGLNAYGRDNTYGGYFDVLVVRADFLIRIPLALKPGVAAPILCAGVTTYSPMKHWGGQAGQKVGIIGFGGLGDMALKPALAMGAQVVVFTSTDGKLAQARKLGADTVLESDAKALEAHAPSVDYMLSTVPQRHDLNPYLPLLKCDCTLVVVGALEVMSPVNNQQVACHRRCVSGSLIGSIAETQAVIDFCARHGIGPATGGDPVLAARVVAAQFGRQCGRQGLACRHNCAAKISPRSTRARSRVHSKKVPANLRCRNTRSGGGVRA